MLVFQLATAVKHREVYKLIYRKGVPPESITQTAMREGFFMGGNPFLSSSEQTQYQLGGMNEWPIADTSPFCNLPMYNVCMYFTNKTNQG